MPLEISQSILLMIILKYKLIQKTLISGWQLITVTVMFLYVDLFVSMQKLLLKFGQDWLATLQQVCREVKHMDIVLFFDFKQRIRMMSFFALHFHPKWVHVLQLCFYLSSDLWSAHQLVKSGLKITFKFNRNSNCKHNLRTDLT